MELLHNLLFTLDFLVDDIASSFVILVCIRTMYQFFYSKDDCLYFENQFAIFCASSIACIVVLEVYYKILRIYDIDENGIILVVFLTFGGLICDFLNKHYFSKKTSDYKASDEEYLFIISIVFMAISVKMVLREIIDFTIPLCLLLGRYFWLDTKDLKSIFSMLRVNHERIIETSSIYFIGMVMSTFLSINLKSKYLTDVVISSIYAILVLFLYPLLRKWFHRRKNSSKV